MNGRLRRARLVANVHYRVHFGLESDIPPFPRVIGEPGLGKSRLIEEFHARLREVPHTWAEWSCSQLLQNTPLHPIAEWGRQRFGGADVAAEQH